MSANPLGVDSTATFSALSEPTEPQAETEAQSVTDETVETQNPAESGPLTSSDESPQQGNEETTRRVKAKLGDQDVEFEILTEGVDPDEFKTGLLTKKAFYQKTEELANIRKDFEAKARDYDSNLEQMKSLIDYKNSILKSEAMQELKQSDPQEYYEKLEEAERLQENFSKWNEVRSVELQKAQDEIRQKELSRLPDVIPEWQDSEVMKSEANGITQMLLDKGYTKEQIANVYDAGLISTFRDAYLYNKAKSKPLPVKQKPALHVKSKSTASGGKEKSLEEIFYGGG